MNTPTSVEFRIGELTGMKTRPRSGPNAGYADITVRVGLGEDFQVAAPFLAFLLEAGHPVTFTIGQVQARLGDM